MGRGRHDRPLSSLVGLQRERAVTPFRLGANAGVSYLCTLDSYTSFMNLLSDGIDQCFPAGDRFGCCKYHREDTPPGS